MPVSDVADCGVWSRIGQLGLPWCVLMAICPIDQQVRRPFDGAELV
jgi:hypothetical protein